jgi:hypothetical protein
LGLTIFTLDLLPGGIWALWGIVAHWPGENG